jgi:copper chaperone CopZ
VDGVVSADVTFPDKATVKVKAGKVKSDQLVKALKKAGYSGSSAK